MAHTKELAYWTSFGDLGTLEAGEKFSLTLTAEGAAKVVFISGDYPGSLTITGSSAVLSGTAGYFTTEKSYAFTLRAYSADGVTDQKFYIAVNTIPLVNWTSPENLGFLTIGKQQEIELTANYDNDLKFELVSGALPPGLFLDPDGYIYGITAAADLEAPTRDTNTWNVSAAVSPIGGSSYSFTIRAIDPNDRGRYSDRKFRVRLIESNQTRVDTTFVDASEDLLTIDSADILLPIILTKGGRMPEIRHDNQYIDQIKAWDPAGRGLEWSFIDFSGGYDTGGFEVYSLGYDSFADEEPYFLNIERFTGYISGQLPPQRYNRKQYRFTVRVRRVDALSNEEFIDASLGYDSNLYDEYLGDPSHVQDQFPIDNSTDFVSLYSTPYDGKFKVDTIVDRTKNYILPIKGDGDIDFDWYDNGIKVPNNTVSTLTLIKGELSEIRVHAVWRKDPARSLYYELVTGGLPSGLSLSPSGAISGRASYRARSGIYTFDVRAYDAAEDVFDEEMPVSTTRTFQIDLNPAVAGTTEITAVYDTYYQAFLTKTQRNAWINLITDSNIFSPKVLYRPDDLSFGRRLNLEFLAVPGISEYHAAEFASTVRRNFSNKRFALGAVHATTVYEGKKSLYDVIYVDVIDPLITLDFRGTPSVVYARSQRTFIDSLGNTVYTNLASVDGSNITSDTTDLTADATSSRAVYPATLKTQRQRLREYPGQITDSLLPKWMRSPQQDGRPLGLIPAVVLAFVNVGEGPEIIRKIRRSGHNIKSIDFHVDRLVIKNTPKTSKPTVFDKTSSGFTDTNSATALDKSGTSFDLATTQDKYIMFQHDGEIYGNY